LLYLICAIALGAGFLYWSVVLLVGHNRQAPMETFRYSIVYLMALFVALLVDHYLMPVTYLV
jgi:protoheme IX farnesyltransferase